MNFELVKRDSDNHLSYKVMINDNEIGKIDCETNEKFSYSLLVGSYYSIFSELKYNTVNLAFEAMLQTYILELEKLSSPTYTVM